MQLQQQENALNFLAKKLHQHQHPRGKAYKRIDLVCYWFALLECRYNRVYLDEIIEDSMLSPISTYIFHSKM